MLSAPFSMMQYWKGWKLSGFHPKHRPLWFIDLLNRLFTNMEIFLMPTKHQNNWKNNGDNPFEFASLRLDDSKKAHFSGWFAENGSAFEDIIASLVLTGNKMSFSWDEKSSCYIASMTCFNSKSANFQTVMTSRSEDWFEALMMNCYKAIVLCENGSWPKNSKDNNWG